MLHLFRRQDKWKRWILGGVIITLAAGMLLLFVRSPTGTSGVGVGEIASCAGEPISAVEFRRSYREILNLYRQQFGDENFERLLPNLRVSDQALNRLITDCAVAFEANRFGLFATKEEIQDRVLAEPVFKDSNGRFVGTGAYQRILLANNWSPASFEENVRKLILRQKLESLLTDSIEPSPQDLREQFARQNQEFRVRYVYFDPENVAGTEVDEADLKSYFEQNSETYRIPEKRRAQYLLLPIDREAVQLSEKQIKDRMDTIPEVERIRASHILFKVPPGGDDTEARKKAEAALARIKAGEDFAKVAREVSEDTSAPNGGDLGFFTRGEMVPEFSDAAFGLEAGEVSGLVKSPFGIHIIKTTSKPRTREESRRLLAESQLREEQANEMFKTRASSLLAELRGGAPLEEVAKREGLQSGETELVTASERIKAIPVGQDFTQQLFAAEEGAYLEPYPASTQFVIARVAEIVPARMPAFDTVRDKVLADYQKDRAEDLAKQRAQELFQEALKGGGLEAVAKKEGLKVTSTDFFTAGSTVDDILQFSPVLHERVVSMEPGELSPPITVAGKQIVFELIEKSKIDEAAFEAKKEELAQSLRQQQRNSFFAEYVQNVVDKLRENQRIVVNRELLDSITGSL